MTSFIVQKMINFIWISFFKLQFNQHWDSHNEEAVKSLIGYLTRHTTQIYISWKLFQKAKQKLKENITICIMHQIHHNIYFILHSLNSPYIDV